VAGEHPRILCPTVWPHTLVPLGDRAVTIDLSGVPDESARDLIRSLDERVRADAPVGLTALVPAIRTLTLHYEPTQTVFGALQHYIESALMTLTVTAASPSPPVVIPVCYGGVYGPDLEVVATTHRVAPDAIVSAHTDGHYTVAMIGFLPGFPYLEGLSPALHTPRRATPRTSVPAGSVGIGGSSTGVYSCSSPGGWQIIGRTPRALFDPVRASPSLLQPGDQVRFVAITVDELRERTEDA
jgi:inhibitor of KinA